MCVSTIIHEAKLL